MIYICKHKHMFISPLRTSSLTRVLAAAGVSPDTAATSSSDSGIPV